MDNILISNLAPLGDNDITFFRELIDSFERHGFNCFFLSGPYNRIFSDEYLPFDWNIKKWEQDYTFDEEAFNAGIKYIDDHEKWIKRIEILSKQGSGKSDAPAVFKLMVSVGYQLLQVVQPRLYLAWNHFCPHAGIIYEMASRMGCRCEVLERGNLSDTWFLESGGLLGSSILVEETLESLIRPWEIDGLEIVGKGYLQQYGFDGKPKYDQTPLDKESEALLESPCNGLKIVFFPPDDLSLGFIPEDRNDRLIHLPKYRNSLDAANHLAEINKNGITIFKPHPSFGDYNFGIQPSNELEVRDIDYRKLIPWADAIATTGSGLQLHALGQGKPVLSMGRDLFSNKNITFDASCPTKIECALQQIKEEGLSVERIVRFHRYVGFLLTRYLLNRPNSHECYRKPRQAVRELVEQIGPSKSLPLNFGEVQNIRKELIGDTLLKKLEGQHRENAIPSVVKEDNLNEYPSSFYKEILTKSSQMIVWDFDHTLLLNNSTELFLETARPKTMAFALTRVSDYFVKKFALNSNRFKDPLRLIFVIILMPWTLLYWYLCSKKIASKWSNSGLLKFSKKLVPSRNIIITNGLEFVVNPIVRAMGLKWQLHGVKIFSLHNSPRWLGKLEYLKNHVFHGKLSNYIAISDAKEDAALLKAGGSGHLIDWADNRFKAFRGFYFPFRYYAEGKYPNRNIFMRQLVGEDFVILLLSYSFFPNNILGIILSFLSFMSIYEIGYYQNDFNTLKVEARNRISKEARAFVAYPIIKGAIFFNIGIILLITFLNYFHITSISLLWLIAGQTMFYLLFRYFNWLVPEQRKGVFMGLHLLKLFIYLPVFTLTPIGVPLLFSQLMVQFGVYNVYRCGGEVSDFKRQRTRLFIFLWILPLFILIGNGIVWSQTTFYYLLASLIWLYYRANTEANGKLNLRKFSI